MKIVLEYSYVAQLELACKISGFLSYASSSLKKLKLPTINCIDPFLFRLIFSRTNASIIVWNFPVPNVIDLNRLPKEYDAKAFLGISLISEGLLMLASKILGGNDNTLRARLVQDTVMMRPSKNGKYRETSPYSLIFFDEIELFFVHSFE